MAFTVGQVVRPRRRYAGRSSTCTTSATGRRTYAEDTLIDSRGRRSGFARIVAARGSVELQCTFFDRSGSGVNRYLYWNPTAWQTSTAYLDGEIVQANGKLWICAIGGTSDSVGLGPSGSGTIVDGSVTWSERVAPDSNETLSAVQSGAVYEVEVWDVDAAALATDYYGEGELVALTSYADYLAAGTDIGNPENVLPTVSAVHVDLGNPPQAVADIARAYEVAGVDPRA